MKIRGYKIFITLLLSLLIFSGCIHDYPHANGIIPETTQVDIEVHFDLMWDNRNHFIEFPTKATNERPHHFVIEAMKNGKVVCRDDLTLTDMEFLFGSFKHTFSRRLSNDTHQIAVWYERENENGFHGFEYEDLSVIHLNSTSIENSENMNCGFVNTIVDLNEFNDSKDNSIKMELQHAGARFKIVTTDVEKFIEDHSAEWDQGDKFTLELVLSETIPSSFNAYESTLHSDGESRILSGNLYFPLSDKKELNIAEGFVFCNEEDYLTMKILVYNGAKAIVTQTPTFSFPVKRGRITTVRSEFLSFPIEGSLDVDNIWEGNIDIDLNEEI